MSGLSGVPSRCEFDLDKLVVKLDEVVPSDVEVVDETVAKITDLIENTGCWGVLENIDLALREALANAIIHGNCSDPAKLVRVCVALHEDCAVLIVVKDAGSGFDPEKLPNPVEGQNIFATHGRGIYLINQLMSDVRFSFESGTAIYMTSRSPKLIPGMPDDAGCSQSSVNNLHDGEQNAPNKTNTKCEELALQSKSLGSGEDLMTTVQGLTNLPIKSAANTCAAPDHDRQDGSAGEVNRIFSLPVDAGAVPKLLVGGERKMTNSDIKMGGGEAFGRPGIPPRWTSSSKEGMGTAYSTASRIWFTLSHGILNEIYYPTIDRPQVRDLQFLITDGETFFHEEKRDLESKIESIEQHTLGYRVETADPKGRYRITKEIITDPHQSCVLIHTKVEADAELLARLQLYVLLAPHLEVGGWGNSARKYRLGDNKILIAWKGRTYLAMGTNLGFNRTSCGYVGASDGWQDLNGNFRMDWQFDRAEDGNIAVMGQIDVSRKQEFTLGLAFGDGLHAAVSTLMQSLSLPFARHREKYIDQWHRVCCDIPNLDQYAGDNGRLYRISHSLLLEHEDKTFAGALIASASIPWGDAKGDEDLGGYHLVWTRDMVNSATGLMACGNMETPRRALVYLACAQRPDGGFPQNFWLDGRPYWSGIQLDEVAFPVILAWRLWKAGALEEFDPYPMVRAAAAFLIREGPMTQQERWEENSGYSPSTLAAAIAALICAADFARSRGEADSAQFLEEYADFLESHIESWTVTTQGSLVPEIPRHYIRIHPTDLNDPVPKEDPNCGMLPVRNQAPGAPWEFPAKDIVDAGFLELVRYGIRKPGDPLIEASLKVVDAVLKVTTPFGPCWRRYNHDGYGQRPDGGPFEGWGRGRAWPLLTGERAHYELAASRKVDSYIRAIEGFASRGGMLPEQVWDESNHAPAEMALGRPAGSAMPLMWAHAEYIKLLRSRADGQVFDLIPVVSDRYLHRCGSKFLEVWKPIRQVGQVAAGKVLRVQAPAPFRLHWTTDEWQTFSDTDSNSSGLGIYFVDIPVSQKLRAPIRFTFFWTGNERWEGKDFEVRVLSSEGPVEPSADSRGNGRRKRVKSVLKTDSKV